MPGHQAAISRITAIVNIQVFPAFPQDDGAQV
jgi:hypothetical protein